MRHRSIFPNWFFPATVIFLSIFWRFTQENHQSEVAANDKPEATIKVGLTPLISLDRKLAAGFPIEILPIASNENAWDIVICDLDLARTLLNDGWAKTDFPLFQKLRSSLIPEIAAETVLEPQLRGSFPLLWGRFGYSYDRKNSATLPQNWSQLFANPNLRVTFDHPELLTLSALAALKFPKKSASTDASNAAGKLIVEKSASSQFLNHHGFALSTSFETRKVAIQSDEQIGFVAPNDFPIYWIAVVLVSQKTKFGPLIEKWLNHLLAPGVLATWARDSHTLPSTRTAWESLPDEYKVATRALIVDSAVTESQ